MPASERLAQAPKQRAAAAIAAAVLVAAPLTAEFEGYRSSLYPDPVGIPTYCYGETELLKYDPSHIYAKTECMALMRERMKRDYAPKILDCVPNFIRPGYRNAFGASIDASYNAGPAAFCRSRMARSFNLRNLRQGCTGFVGWYETAKGKRLNGLVRRRAAERDVCLRPVT